MQFYKYHALGNDYLVIDPASLPCYLTPDRIRAICHRNYGLGSDGILLGPLPSNQAAFSLQIFNPDGSEAEKSGNGLRIFCRYLWDRGLVSQQPFLIETRGGLVQAVVLEEGKLIQVELGRVSFWSSDIPVRGAAREVIQEELIAGDRTFRFCAATIGNPHCIILLDEITPALAKQYGPLIENYALFPNRTNVQFMQVLDRDNIRIEIWERGAGYTLASGSSSSAAAAAAYRLELCDQAITVHMPGGRLEITLSQGYDVTMTGPVTRIAKGWFADEIFDAS